MEKKVNKNVEKATTYVNIAITKKDAEIVADLVLLELEKLASLERELQAHGIDATCSLNCRRIDLKYLLEKFSKASE